MHIQALLILGTAATSIMGASIRVPRNNGYVVPDLGDGVFSASFGADGLVNVTRLDKADAANKVTTEVASKIGPSRRALPVSGAGCDTPTSNHEHWESARHAFQDMCDAGAKIRGNSILYSMKGDHVAFGCSWGGDNPCSSAEYWEFLQINTARCGSYVGGWVDMADWKKQYGMEQRGASVCGWAKQIGW